MTNYNEEPVDEIYTSLYADSQLLNDQLGMVSSEIITQEVSKYPIFIASTEPIDLGKLLFTPDKHLTNWNISMSTLENLVNAGIVQLEKVDDFRKVFKEPEKYYCFLVIDENDSQFIFLPRTKSGTQKL